MERFIPHDDTPLYVQVADELRARILDGEFTINDTIPSEAEIVKMYGVSRVTARQAVGLLSDEGLLGTIQGKGSIVKALAVEQNILGLREFRNDLRRQGHVPSFEILGYERIYPAKSIRSVFGLGKSDEVHSIERLKRSDGRPMILERLYLPCHILPEIDQLELRTRWFGDLLVDNGVTLWGARKKVQPVVLGSFEAKTLDVRPGSIGLLIDRSTWQAEDAEDPVFLTRSILSGEATRFFVDSNVDQTDFH